ncbi:MAG: hypothetical protein A2V77_03560 [Anaeromyxobacter sp. RBG_16_69_14]|nr:MAG: hypothetical protein A2V77_03560 [Anaeromyxobacter sp. RBG_16_69_14]
MLALTATLATVVLSDDPGADAAKAYVLDASASTASAKVGESGKLVLAIRLTAPGWHVHPQAPLKIRFDAPPGLRVERAELGRRDALDPKAAEPRFETAFVATAAGAQESKATLDFFMCSDAACVKQTRTVAIPVIVR